MIARHKLNILVFTGVLVVSAVLGAAFQSWLVCVLTGISLILASLLVGHIRLQKSRRFRGLKRKR